MLRDLRLFALLAAGILLPACGCELPKGPITWRPGEHLENLAQMHRQGELSREYAPNDPAGDDPCTCNEPVPRHRCRDHHRIEYWKAHHDVPQTGPHIDAPWPKYHPVPTKPVFEPRGLYEAGIVAERASQTETR